MKIKKLIQRLANCAVSIEHKFTFEIKTAGVDKNKEQISSRCWNVIKYVTKGTITPEELVEGLKKRSKWSRTLWLSRRKTGVSRHCSLPCSNVS